MCYKFVYTFYMVSSPQNYPKFGDTVSQGSEGMKMLCNKLMNISNIAVAFTPILFIKVKFFS